MNCVLLDDQGNYVNTIVTDYAEWYDPTWTIIPIPEGHTWNGVEVVPTGALLNEVTPEVI
jgi:hypothetical protein